VRFHLRTTPAQRRVLRAAQDALSQAIAEARQRAERAIADADAEHAERTRHTARVEQLHGQVDELRQALTTEATRERKKTR
jgi:hypothetical protein